MASVKPVTPHTFAPSAVVLHSRQRMQQGIKLMASGQPNAALGYFDKVIALRASLPWRSDPYAAWLVAAAWMNRSDALRHNADPQFLQEAIVALDHAHAAMATIPLAQNPAFPDRLILLWLNRADIEARLGNVHKASKAFAHADALLDFWGRSATTTRWQLNGMYTLNHAKLLLQSGHPLQAWQQLKNALNAQNTFNERLFRAQAQTLQCHALALLLDEPNGHNTFENWTDLALATAEAALTDLPATAISAPWPADLLRFSVRIFRICKPEGLAHFLARPEIQRLINSHPSLAEDIDTELLRARVQIRMDVLTRPSAANPLEQNKLLRALQRAANALKPHTANASIAERHS